MSKFADYNELVEPLELPINGKVYRIPQVGMADGIRFTAILKSSTEPLDDAEFFAAMLGDTYDEMLADNIPHGALTRASMTALADFSSGRGAAEILWETGGDPKALQEYVAANQPNRASRRSLSTAGAKKTQTRASTKVTSSQKS